MTEGHSDPGDDRLSINDLFFEDVNLSTAERSCTRKRKAENESEDFVLGKQESELLPKRKLRRTKRLKLLKKESTKMILRPNYFVGIQVSNPQVHRMVRKVQENILKEHPSLYVALVPIPTLHITLAVTHLSGISEVQRASEAVKKCSDAFRETSMKTPLCLSFTGLKTFGSQVLYVGVDQSEDLLALETLANSLDEMLKDYGFKSSSKKTFSPHLTILKMSRGWNSKKRNNTSMDFCGKRLTIFELVKTHMNLSKIPKSSYADMENIFFGNQFVKGIQLLSMNKPKDGQGYYFCSHQETFFDIMSLESEDHGECCKKPLLTIKRTGEFKRGIHTSASSEKYSVGDMGKILACVGAAGVLIAFCIKCWRSH